MAANQPTTDTIETAVPGQHACSLCGLTIRRIVYLGDRPDSALIFCCGGCRNVWQILDESGQLSDGQSPLDHPIFRQAQSLGLIGQRDEHGRSAQTISDSPAIDLQTPGGSVEDLRECLLSIDGMWCSSCAWLITQTLQRQKGVVSASVSFATDSARIVYKPARIGSEQILASIRSLGYSAVDSNMSTPDSAASLKVKRDESIRVGIAVVFAMNVMMLTPNIYASDSHGGAIFIHKILPWALLLLSLPVYVCAWPVFVRAFQALKHGAVIMETLVCLGASVAMTFSVWCVLSGSNRSYFDTADMLLALVMVGKLVEANMRSRAVSSIELLSRAMPKKATLIVKGIDSIPRERTVALEQIGFGDLIRVRAGDIIGADGEVVSGVGSVDESLLTGEAKPVGKVSGDSVTGGSIIVDGMLDIHVTHPADSGALRNIANLVQESLHKKTVSEERADRISRIFVPLVILLAVGTFVGVFYTGHSIVSAITRAVAVLVVACPCALGIATPMAVVAAIASAARRGILIADPSILEIAPKVTEIVFDKTGTLTEGRFEILEVFPKESDMRRFQQLESMSNHPIAKAICKSLDTVDDSDVLNFKRIEGLGVLGDIEGAQYFVGNVFLCEYLGCKMPSEFQHHAQRWQAQAATVVYFGTDRDILGWIALGDKIRPGASMLLGALKTMHLGVRIVSGDSNETVEAIATELGIADFQGGVTPQCKLDIVKAVSGSGAIVGMVGDGINDAAALASADLGVAMATGTDIAGRASGATIMDNRVERLTELIALGRSTSRIIRQNLFWALAYNLVCIPLAVLGWITPIWAAAAMLISSLTVLVNTQRLGLGKRDLAELPNKTA